MLRIWDNDWKSCIKFSKENGKFIKTNHSYTYISNIKQKL